MSKNSPTNAFWTLPLSNETRQRLQAGLLVEKFKQAIRNANWFTDMHKVSQTLMCDENDVHGLVGWHTGIDRVQKPDELLMPVLLHVAPDHGSIKDVEHGKQCGDAVTLVIMGHRAKSPLFEREPRLRAVKRLNLAFFIEGQHDGVG